MARSLENTIRDTLRALKSINEEKQEVLAEGKSPHHKDLIDAGYNMMHSEVQKGKPGGGKYGANTRVEKEIWRSAWPKHPGLMARKSYLQAKGGLIHGATLDSFGGTCKEFERHEFHQ